MRRRAQTGIGSELCRRAELVDVTNLDQNACPEARSDPRQAPENAG